MKTEQIHLTTEPSLKTAIEEQAKRETRSVNNMIEHALKVYLEIKRTQSPCGDCTKQETSCRTINCQWDKFNLSSFS